jgi:hypothetical protein
LFAVVLFENIYIYSQNMGNIACGARCYREAQTTPISINHTV